MCLYACFTWNVYAEENAVPAEQIIEAMPQQPLVDTEPEPGHEPEITEILTSEEPTAETQKAEGTEEENSTPVEQSIIQTPQPPLIDAQPEPTYEPEINDKAPDEENKLPVEQAVEATPQPPLIDAQQKPSYEPDTDDSTTEEDITSTTQTPEPSTEQPVSEEVVDTEESGTVQEETKTTEQPTKWLDTRPQRVSADWLQLTSGEWLRGRIIAMQKADLEFDSDELKKLVIEWKKVKYIKSSAPYRLRFDGRVDAIGAIEITQKEVRVTTDYDDKVFERSKLLTIASGKETEISYWTTKITLSINVRRGNTYQTDFTSKINAKRQTIDSRLVLDYLGNFTEVEETETINNHRVNGTYDIFITRDVFVTPITAEYYRDPFINIEQRIYVGAAIGYSLINTNETEWDISGGPAYQSTKFVSVQPDQSPEDNALTLILSTKFDTELNSMVDLEGTYSVTLGDEAIGNYSHHSIFTVETELTDKLDFDVSLVWDRVRSPVPDENNITPEQDDFRLMIGLGYDL